MSPRAVNKFDGPEGEALDTARAVYDQAEKVAQLAHTRLRDAFLTALDAGMSISEAARRSGYTRDWISRKGEVSSEY